MDENTISMINKYTGSVYKNDYVIYAKNGDFATIGSYKKDIWQIIGIKGNDCEIKNISKVETTFTTNRLNLVNIDIVMDVVNDWKEYISTRSVVAYDKLMAQIEYKNPCSEVFLDKPDSTYKDYKNHKFDTSKYTTIKSGEDNMMNRLINDNMNAAKNGAVLSAGNTLNKVVKDAIRGQVPRKYRKLMDTPVADIVVANVANVAVQNFAKNNRKAQVATSAMMEAAMVSFMNSFNLDKIISDTLKNVNLDDLLDESVL
jgi:hypothetical protein